MLTENDTKTVDLLVTCPKCNSVFPNKRNRNHHFSKEHEKLDDYGVLD